MNRSEVCCPICGFIFTRRWMYRLQKIAERGVREVNRKRPRHSPKYLLLRHMAVMCEECGQLCPEIWDTTTTSWRPWSLRTS